MRRFTRYVEADSAQLGGGSPGAGHEAYSRDGSNYFTMHELLAPAHQVARFCGMRWLPPFVVSGTMQDTDEYFRAAAGSYRAALEGLMDGTLDVDHLSRDSLLNDALPSMRASLDAR